jgi:hypothetical protein
VQDKGDVVFEAAHDYREHLSPAGWEFVASIGTMLAELDASPARR